MWLTAVNAHRDSVFEKGGTFNKAFIYLYNHRIICNNKTEGQNWKKNYERRIIVPLWDTFFNAIYMTTKYHQNIARGWNLQDFIIKYYERRDNPK